jgi:hypothetical protein
MSQNYPVPQKARTTSHENVSIWDELLVYDTYGLVARINKQIHRIKESLKHAWAFTGSL